MASQTVTFQHPEDNPQVRGLIDVDPREVWQNRSQLTIIDVRRPDEFNGELGHIPGARNVVLDALPQRLAEIPLDHTIVFVCLAGGRSTRAAAFALQNGLANVVNMKGGMLRWTELELEAEGKS